MTQDMQLEDWLDDLCVRFIINLPPEELQSVERICFQVEEAQWFYEDFIRPLDPSLPSLSLRAFSLRIFQHCPLFSQWSAQHHTTAFAEFLAYKSRVPVRGAIMLNEAMDEVVLVKGWKKSANWSFPRGKINKDENDLDCAVREVYEETGFDIRAAGLVKEERDMKYIEVTMREQHMRLYVFRGVPRDTYFAPKTRKEISKIEWYKLTDLPTLKKNRPHEGSDGNAPNANKFYMVAPFLHPLRKWIAQQKKRETRYSSHLAAPPMVMEEATTEDEHDVGATFAGVASQPVTDLPEVSMPAVAGDPTSHLKSILNIGQPHPDQPAIASHPTHMQNVDADKSNALLALLRGGFTQRQVSPQMPRDSIPGPLQGGELPPQSGLARPPQAIFRETPSPSQGSHQLQSQIPAPYPSQAPLFSEILRGASTIAAPGNTPGLTLQPLNFGFQPADTSRLAQWPAPYQRTGDPMFAPQGSQRDQQTIPPASALPTLTSHTKSLLDAFKTPAASLASQSSGSAPPDKQALLNAFFNPPGVAESQSRAREPANIPSLRTTTTASQILPGFASSGNEASMGRMRDSKVVDQGIADAATNGKAHPKQTLLELFTQSPKTVSSAPPPRSEQQAKDFPVELADTTPEEAAKKSQATRDDMLLALLKQTQSGSLKSSESIRPLPREGETSATISGPLNQPDFEAISRSARQVSNGMGRSPLTTHRTLYDPNRPAPVKILARPDDSVSPPPPPPPRSPRTPKQHAKRAGKEKTASKETPKPFQPQILRRPQAEGASRGPGALEPVTQTDPTLAPLSTATDTISSSPQQLPSAGSETRESAQATLQADAHKQSLLSLFGPAADSTPKPAVVRPPASLVSPLSAGQIGSPLGEIPFGSFEPISTRTSRVGSIASVTSGPVGGRPVMEKRQTGAENKAFLLGYLGRIANQEG